MAAKAESVQQLVQWLKTGSQEKQIQAAMALRNLASDVSNKNVIREGGGIQALLQLLDAGPDNVLTVVSAETLSCLAADDPDNREAIRAADGIQKLVGLLAAGPDADCTHRALLALRIVTDREADRNAILKAGGIPQLVKLLSAGPDSEITEYAAAALGNLAAGGHALKDAIRGAGGVKPLVCLLKDNPEEISAELAAVALRNMALQNNLNRQAILAAGGLQPLLQLLSTGQERLVVPLQCEIVYNDANGDASANQRRFVASQCCFDPRRAELCIAARVAESSLLGCFAKPGQGREAYRKSEGTTLMDSVEKAAHKILNTQGSPRDKSAERYSLLRKLTLTEPDARTLELVFTIADLQGAPRVVEPGHKVPPCRLERIIISPCAATELKGAIMRMLTRTHLEREFRIGKHSRPSSIASMSQIGLGRTPSMVRYNRASIPIAAK